MLLRNYSAQILCKSQLQSAKTFMFKCGIEVIIMTCRLKEREKIQLQKGKMVNMVKGKANSDSH